MLLDILLNVFYIQYVQYRKGCNVKPIEGKQVLSLAMQGELLDQIDEYRFKHRFNTRSEAIRYLLEYAISKDPAPGQSKTK